VTDPLAADEHQDAVSQAAEIYKGFAPPTTKQLNTLANGAFRKGGGTLLLALATGALQATGDAYSFTRTVPDSTESANAQKDATTWGKLALRAYTKLLPLHEHDQYTKSIKTTIAQLKAFTAASSGVSGG
jgi:hypothetical protein